VPKVIQIISLSPWLVKEDTQPFGPCAQCVAQDGLLLVFCLLHAIIFPLHTRALSVNSADTVRRTLHSVINGQSLGVVFGQLLRIGGPCEFGELRVLRHCPRRSPG
jgi:hypothetical protein